MFSTVCLSTLILMHFFSVFPVEKQKLSIAQKVSMVLKCVLCTTMTNIFVGEGDKKRVKRRTEVLKIAFYYMWTYVAKYRAVTLWRISGSNCFINTAKIKRKMFSTFAPPPETIRHFENKSFHEEKVRKMLFVLDLEVPYNRRHT